MSTFLPCGETKRLCPQMHLNQPVLTIPAAHAKASHSLASAIAPPCSSIFALLIALLFQNVGSFGFSAIASVYSDIDTTKSFSTLVNLCQSILLTRKSFICLGFDFQCVRTVLVGHNLIFVHFRFEFSITRYYISSD